MRVAVAVAVVLLAGCGSEVEDRVLAELKDPESAQFGEITERRGVICGEVNAKNGFGGMTGAQGFMLRDDKLYLPVPVACCKVHQVDTLTEGTRAMLAQCDAELPPPR